MFGGNEIGSIFAPALTNGQGLKQVLRAEAEKKIFLELL